MRESRLTRGEEKSLADVFRWLAGALSGDDPQTGLYAIDPARLPARVGEQLERIRTVVDDTGSRQSHEAERVRLFEAAPGGVPVPPYGSWWLEGRLQGETTLAVAEFYRQEGVEPATALADYVPAELELVQLLLRHQLAARLTGKSDLAERARQSEAEFLQKLVLPWLPLFCAAGRAATSQPLWLAVVDLLELLVTAEYRRVAGEAGARLKTAD